MESLEFLKEARRLCSHYDLCAAGCPLYKKCIFYFRDMNETKEETEKKIEQNAAIIEQWSKEHPIITNARKFEEVFGSKRPHELVSCDVCDIAGDYAKVKMQKTEWWDEPYKEPEHEL